MNNTDKQPQTVYVPTPQENSFNDLEVVHVKTGIIVDKVHEKELFCFTPEELEALKVEWQREAASMAFRAGRSYQGMKDHYPNLTEYLNEKYPLPQPPKQQTPSL